jgi:hypothetical protein
MRWLSPIFRRGHCVQIFLGCWFLFPNSHQAVDNLAHGRISTKAVAPVQPRSAGFGTGDVG